MILRLYLILLAAATLALSCSVPKLETSGCAEARNTVKRFYSLHFANAINENAEYAQVTQQLLTDKLQQILLTAEPKEYFTKTADFPKAFRVGTCTQTADDSAAIEVVLLWRDDERNEQNEVRAHLVKSGNDWLIDTVEK